METVEQHQKLDVRVLNRRGSLSAGAQFEFGSIRGHNTGNELLVWWNGAEVGTIRLLRTPCNYGGSRNWFQCPVGGCGQRVGILYRAGRTLACRHCSELRYSSQREDSGGRRLRRARKLLARLGLSTEKLVPGLTAKPKGMQLNTWQRLSQRYQFLLEGALPQE
jgi:hypothetical protein